MDEMLCPRNENKWDWYDNLPKIERDKLKYGLFSYGPWNEKQVQRVAAITYGLDHPQANGEFLCPLKP